MPSMADALNLFARESRTAVAVAIRAAGCPRGFNLFLGPDVRLGDFEAFFGAGNLTLVALR